MSYSGFSILMLQISFTSENIFLSWFVFSLSFTSFATLSAHPSVGLANTSGFKTSCKLLAFSISFIISPMLLLSFF